MHTPASVAKHPIHPMLVTIPIGLWLFSLVCDLVVVLANGGDAWRTVAHYTMVGGIVGALLAAVPGFIDMLSLSGGTKKTALTHMALNLTVVALYVINAWLRTGDAAVAGTPFVLSLIAVALLAVSGWLGGKMVYVHGVAVDVAPEPGDDARAAAGRHARA